MFIQIIIYRISYLLSLTLCKDEIRNCLRLKAIHTEIMIHFNLNRILNNTSVGRKS